MMSGNKKMQEKKQLPVTKVKKKKKRKHACNGYWEQARTNIKAAVTNTVFVKYWLESLPASTAILEKYLPVYQPSPWVTGTWKDDEGPPTALNPEPCDLKHLDPKERKSDTGGVWLCAPRPISLCSASVPWSLRGRGVEHRSRRQRRLQTGLHLL